MHMRRRLHGSLTLWLLLALSLPHAAIATDYLMLHTEATGALLVDRASIRREGDSAQAWTLYRHDRPMPATDAVPGHIAQRTRFLFDCKSLRLAIAERHYFATRTGTQPSRTESVATPRFASPGSQSERMLLAAVCAR